ncbi:MAG: transporter substrate-binding protein, partial [Deltaproteobacteria bacterium]|nr:transporter substrate-binding protein [Deltaproteobacteria bacterium]
MVRIAIALLLVSLTINSASAQTPVRVMTGYAATSGPHAVLWMAREAGLFDKNGIKAEVA